MTDPISDMITRLRNAVSAKHSRVDIPASKLKAEIAAFAEARMRGQGVAVVDGRIVENLHVATAKALIGKAEAIAALAV